MTHDPHTATLLLASAADVQTLASLTPRAEPVAWDELWSTLTLRQGSIRRAVVLGSAMLGVAAGVVGVFAMLRKRALVADALSHATLPGIALAFLLAPLLALPAKSLPVLLAGAAATGVLGVLCIQLLLRATRLHEDAAIGIVLSVFFGAGVVGSSYIQENAGGHAAGLSDFIYGQTAAMQASDATLMALVAAAAVAAALLLRKELTLVCFNDAFARTDGWPVSAVDLAIMALVVVVVVAGLQAVGLLLVVALLIIPPVAARLWTERVWILILVSAGVGGASGWLGASLSSLQTGKPAGALIVLTAGALFTISLFIAPGRGLLPTSVRRLRTRARIAAEHLLEAAYDQGGRLDTRQLRTLARRRRWSKLGRSLLLRSLRRKGYIHRDHGDGRLSLTTRGAQHGARVARNHRLWEQYLTSYADVAPNHVDWSVDQVEHVLSPELIDELEHALRSRGVTPRPDPTNGARA